MTSVENVKCVSNLGSVFVLVTSARFIELKIVYVLVYVLCRFTL